MMKWSDFYRMYRCYEGETAGGEFRPGVKTLKVVNTRWACAMARDMRIVKEALGDFETPIAPLQKYDSAVRALVLKYGARTDDRRKLQLDEHLEPVIVPDKRGVYDEERRKLDIKYADVLPLRESLMAEHGRAVRDDVPDAVARELVRVAQDDIPASECRCPECGKTMGMQTMITMEQLEAFVPLIDFSKPAPSAPQTIDFPKTMQAVPRKT